MNSGLSNLTVLKAAILPAAFLTGTTYDARITRMGLSVLAQMNGFCGRMLQYNATATLTVNAARPHVMFPHYPVNAIATVEEQTSYGVWASITNPLQVLNAAAGVGYGWDIIGAETSLLRFTYSGGYWFDTADTGGADSQPSGSTAVPSDLQGAWLMQCAAAWRLFREGQMGLGEVPKEDSAGIGVVELLSSVKDALQPYRRLATL